jgi:CheY-like chemotaxis protein
MRRSARLDHTPAIVLTSSYAREDRAKAVRLGANVYIRKPMHLQDFIDIGAIFKQELDTRKGPTGV